MNFDRDLMSRWLLETDIDEVIQDQDSSFRVKAPLPCPDCGEYVVRVYQHVLYLCDNCPAQGLVLEYLIHREGLDLEQARAIVDGLE